MTNIHRFIVFIALLVTVIGCSDTNHKRTFKEVNVEVQQKPMVDAVDNQDPHAFMDQMPNDDIHAAFRSNLATDGAEKAQMPDDDVHKKFKMGDSMATQDALMNSVAPASLSWTTPQGWKESKGSGMRMVTFTAGEGALEVETSVISLAGAAGGIAANVSRWMGQINLEIPSTDEIEKFIQQQAQLKTQSGLVATLIDFTQLQNNDSAQTPSMIAAVIDGENNQIFIKMTGSKEAVLKYLNDFKSLIESLRSNSGA